MVNDEEIVQCVYCHEFQPRSVMHSVFKTGFGTRNGVDVPLGVCTRCEEKNDRVSETKKDENVQITSERST